MPCSTGSASRAISAVLSNLPLLSGIAPTKKAGRWPTLYFFYLDSNRDFGIGREYRDFKASRKKKLRFQAIFTAAGAAPAAGIRWHPRYAPPAGPRRIG